MICMIPTARRPKSICIPSNWSLPDMTRWIRSQYLRKSRKLPHNPNSDKKAERICSQRCAPLFNLLIQTSTSLFPGSSAFRRALPSPSLSSDSAKRQGEGQAQPEVCAAQGPLKQCRHLERVLCALTCPLHCFPSESVSAGSIYLRRTHSSSLLYFPDPADITVDHQ